ncbi:hypothetical protein [Oryzihumus sp.]
MAGSPHPLRAPAVLGAAALLLATGTMALAARVPQTRSATLVAASPSPGAPTGGRTGGTASATAVAPTSAPTPTATAPARTTPPVRRPTPAPPTARPAARPTSRPAPRPRPKPKPTLRTTSAPAPAGVAGVPSALRYAVGRIPAYRPGVVSAWVWSDRYGHYGATNLATREVTISPRVPTGILYSVVVHEYSHALAIWVYGSSAGADVALMRTFGGSAGTARERAADCMAIVQGATWTNYTSCSSGLWREAARVLVSGRRL